MDKCKNKPNFPGFLANKSACGESESSICPLFFGSSMLRKGQGGDEKLFKVNTRVVPPDFPSLFQPSDPWQMAVNYSCQDFGMILTVFFFSFLEDIESCVGESDCDGL